MTYDAERGDIQLALTGDSLVTRRLSVFTEEPYLELVDALRNADVVVTNAETLFHDFKDAPAFVPGGSYMRADPKILAELQWMGVNLLATANNHAYDFGENGLVTNRRNLRQSGLAFAGIGRNMSEAREPRYLDTAAGRVALISVTSSGPQAMYPQHQWRDGRGRPGANMLRHTVRYTIPEAEFAALRRIRDEFRLVSRSGTFSDHSYGASSAAETTAEFFMADLHDTWQYPTPNGYRIAVGETFSRKLIADPDDLAENVLRIRDARRMADWVVVSMHNHEQGDTIDDPSDVTVTFAHAAIDAGADVFHGHGPHRDRGIEIYRGKPIFYSIGHFIYQNETVERVPRDNMLRQRLDPWEAMPADFYDACSGEEWRGEWKGRGLEPARWRDVVALVEFKNRQLASVKLQPIDLGFQRPRSQRGRPMIASGAEADEVLSLFERLCARYGTAVKRDGDVGWVAVQ